jgi:hypothetical protein
MSLEAAQGEASNRKNDEPILGALNTDARMREKWLAVHLMHCENERPHRVTASFVLHSWLETCRVHSFRGERFVLFVK